jgi:hypothetical protein
MLKHWNVHVRREGRSICIGEVNERSEALARCAALSRFGVGEDEITAGDAPLPEEAIYPGDDFDVSPGA